MLEYLAFGWDGESRVTSFLVFDVVFSQNITKLGYPFFFVVPTSKECKARKTSLPLVEVGSRHFVIFFFYVSQKEKKKKQTTLRNRGGVGEMLICIRQNNKLVSLLVM